MTGADEYAQACRAREALQRTVDALMDAAEQRQSGTNQSSSFQVFDENLALQQVVASKTKELQRSLDALGNTQAQLLHAQKLEAVGQLAAGVAHEINTPMQYIGDNIQFMGKAYQRVLALLTVVEEVSAEPGAISHEKADLLRDQLARTNLDFIKTRVPLALEQTIEGVEVVSGIVRAMKEFSHPGSDEMQEADLNRLVATTQTVSRNEWKYVADIQLDLEQDLPPVRAHSREINQVILNMIVNAAHAIAETDAVKAGAKGLITIRTRSDEDGVTLSIRDNGAGIPDSVRARIFDPFFTTKEVGKGTGQGLAIAHAIVTNHGGKIHVDTAVGSGTCFSVLFPLASQVEAA